MTAKEPPDKVGARRCLDAQGAIPLRILVPAHHESSRHAAPIQPSNGRQTLGHSRNWASARPDAGLHPHFIVLQRPDGVFGRDTYFVARPSLTTA